MVRPSSAKALCAGSIPARASNSKCFLHGGFEGPGSDTDTKTDTKTTTPSLLSLTGAYPTAKDGEEFETAKLRLKQIKQTLKEVENEEGAHLDLVDLGTQTGATFPVHAKMYDAIASADIILIDLTGVRPNVCIEAGFALRNHEKNRLVFMFQPNNAHETVPFDLNTFRYEHFKDTGEIPEKLKPHFQTILRAASVGS